MVVPVELVVFSLVYFGSFFALALDPCQRQPFYSTCHTWPDGNGRAYRSQIVMRFYQLGGECISYPYGLCKNDVAASKLFRYRHQCEQICLKDGINSTADTLPLPPPPISFIADVKSIRVEPRYDISTTGNASAANQGGSRDDKDVKPGICPFPEAGEYAVCVRECHLDHECPRNLKCCYNGCGRLCLDPKLIKGDPCTHTVDHGGCYGYFRRWSYDSGINGCKQFIYGGCGGSGNNFMSESVCMDTCWKPDQPGATRPTPRISTTTTRPAQKVSAVHFGRSTASPVIIRNSTLGNAVNDSVPACIDVPLPDGSILQVGFGCTTASGDASSSTSSTTASKDLESHISTTFGPQSTPPTPVCIDVPLPDGTIYHIGANCTSDQPIPASLSLATNQSLRNTSEVSDHITQMLNQVPTRDLPVNIPLCIDVPLPDGSILHIGWQCTTTNTQVTSSTTTSIFTVGSTTNESTRHPLTTGMLGEHTTHSGVTPSIPHSGSVVTTPSTTSGPQGTPPTPVCIDVPLPDGNILQVGYGCTTASSDASSSTSVSEISSSVTPVQASPASEGSTAPETTTPLPSLSTRSLNESSENTTTISWIHPTPTLVPSPTPSPTPTPIPTPTPTPTLTPSHENETETALNQNSTGAVVNEWIYPGLQSNETTYVKPKPVPIYGGGPGWSPVLGAFAPSAVYIPPSALGQTASGPPAFVSISNKSHPEGPGFEVSSNKTHPDVENQIRPHPNGSESEIANITTALPISTSTLTPPPTSTIDHTGKGYVVPNIHNVVQAHTSPYLPYSVPPRLPEDLTAPQAPKPLEPATPAPPLPPVNTSIDCPHRESPIRTPEGTIVTCLPSPFDHDLTCPKGSICFFGGLNFYCCPHAEAVFPMGKKEKQEKKPELKEEVVFSQRISQSKDKKPESKSLENVDQEKNENGVGRKRFV